MNIENNDSMVASLLRMFKNIYYACRRVIIIALHGNSRAVDSIIYILLSAKLNLRLPLARESARWVR